MAQHDPTTMAAIIQRSDRWAAITRVAARPWWLIWQLSIWLILPGEALRAQAAAFAAPVLTDDTAQPFYFTLPAPRGQILDSDGSPLARTKVVHRLTLRVPRLEQETADAYAAWIDAYWPEVALGCSAAVKPDLESLKLHFQHRRILPLPISGPLHDAAGPETPALPEFVEMQTEYARDYPGGRLAAHVIGYVTSSGAPLRGPLHYGEPLWRQVNGRQGLEASMNRVLTGQAGLLVVCYDKDGRAVQRNVLKPAVPGHDVVTTLQREMQTATEKTLAEAARPGAMVVMDAATGSILALASAPDFDPALFAAGLDHASFSAITGDSKRPLFNRAISGLYPPGSVFKIVVALAGLREGRLHPAVRVPCWPEVTVDGRIFRNWSDERGWFDLNAALVRSCNTYFYQAAIAIGDQPIIKTARQLGLGANVNLPLRGAVAGTVPQSVPSAQGQANMAIGQSPILSTPLEVATAMATVADGQRRPHPRLVAQVQDQEGQVLFATPPAHGAPINFSAHDVTVIHDSLYSVVNHQNGTGAKARVKNLRVHGKTGTSQWSHEGEMVTAVWFAGFAKDCEPPLAFAVVLEGRKGERVSGGATAAPVAGKLLAAIAAAPQKHGVRIRKAAAPYQQYTLANIGHATLSASATPPEIARRVFPEMPAPQPNSAQPDMMEVQRAIPVAEPADFLAPQAPAARPRLLYESARPSATGQPRLINPIR